MMDEILARHMEADAEFQKEISEWKPLVATKEDIAELKEFMKSVNIGIGIFKFSWDNAAKIGSFLMLIGGIYLFFKFGIMALFAWLTTNSPFR